LHKTEGEIITKFKNSQIVFSKKKTQKEIANIFLVITTQSTILLLKNVNHLVLKGTSSCFFK
jgi:hypothetical protein